MTLPLSRRNLVAAGIVLPLLALPGCAARLGDLADVEPAIRRLLTLSAERAFARLLTDEGFFRDDIARIQPPPQLGGRAVTAALAVALGTRAVQDRLLRVVNRAAGEGARRAAPAVYASIRDMGIADARAIARGGPTAATDYLARSMGERIFDALFPGVGEALRGAENGVIQRVPAGRDRDQLPRPPGRRHPKDRRRPLPRHRARGGRDPGRSGRRRRSGARGGLRQAASLV